MNPRALDLCGREASRNLLWSSRRSAAKYAHDDVPSRETRTQGGKEAFLVAMTFASLTKRCSTEFVWHIACRVESREDRLDRPLHHNLDDLNLDGEMPLVTRSAEFSAVGIYRQFSGATSDCTLTTLCATNVDHLDACDLIHAKATPESEYAKIGTSL